MTPWKWRSKRKFSVGLHRRRQTVVGAFRFRPPPAIAWGAVGRRVGVRATTDQELAHKPRQRRTRPTAAGRQRPLPGRLVLRLGDALGGWRVSIDLYTGTLRARLQM